MPNEISKHRTTSSGHERDVDKLVRESYWKGYKDGQQAAGQFVSNVLRPMFGIDAGPTRDPERRNLRGVLGRIVGFGSNHVGGGR